MNNKLKKFVKSKDELDAIFEYKEPVLFGYHKHSQYDDFNVYLRNTYNFQFIHILYGVQIKSAIKSMM
jgi:hypothetical protein